MPDLGRIYFPANDTNNIFFISDVDNTRGNDGIVSFRITVKDGKSFNSLQYKLGEDDWKAFNPRNISANLYIVRLKPGQMERLFLRLSTGDEEIIVRSVNVQHSINVQVNPPPPPKLDVLFDVSILDMPAKQFKTDISIQSKDNKITNTLMDIRIIPRPSGLYLDWDANHVELSQGRVSRVIDQSGNNHDGVQSVQANRPLYMASDPACGNSPSIIVDGERGVKSWLESETAFNPGLPQPVSYIVIMTEVEEGEGDFLSGNLYDFGTNSGNSYRIQSAGSSIIGSRSSRGTAVFSANFDSGNTRLFRAGIPEIQGTLNTSTITDVKIGNPDTPHKEFRISRVIMWDRRLSNPEIDAVGSFYSSECSLPWETVEIHTFFNCDIKLIHDNKPISFPFDILTLKSDNTNTFKSDIIIIRPPKINTFKIDVNITSSLPINRFIDYDANFVELSEGTVSKLIDQSGNKRDASNSASRGGRYFQDDTEFNGNPFVLFNDAVFGKRPGFGLYRSETFSTPVSQPMTIIFVGKVDTTGGGGIMNYRSNSTVGLSEDQRGELYLTTGQSGFSNRGIYFPNMGGGPFSITMLINGENSTVYYNTPGGSSTFTGNVGSGNITDFDLGPGLSTGGTPGSVARVLMWDRLLTRDDINNAGNYINMKYGMRWTNIPPPTPVQRTSTFTSDMVLMAPPALTPPPNNRCCCCDYCNEGPTRGEPPVLDPVLPTTITESFNTDIICKKQQVININISIRLLKEGRL